MWHATLCYTSSTQSIKHVTVNTNNSCPFMFIRLLYTFRVREHSIQVEDEVRLPTVLSVCTPPDVRWRYHHLLLGETHVSAWYPLERYIRPECSVRPCKYCPMWQRCVSCCLYSIYVIACLNVIQFDQISIIMLVHDLSNDNTCLWIDYRGSYCIYILLYFLQKLKIHIWKYNILSKSKKDKLYYIRYLNTMCVLFVQGCRLNTDSLVQCVS